MHGRLCLTALRTSKLATSPRNTKDSVRLIGMYNVNIYDLKYVFYFQSTATPKSKWHARPTSRLATQQEILVASMALQWSSLDKFRITIHPNETTSTNPMQKRAACNTHSEQALRNYCCGALRILRVSATYSDNYRNLISHNP